MVAALPTLASRPHGDLETIAGHVDADEHLCHHEFLRPRKLPALAQPCGCGLAVRPRQLFGLSAGLDWDDQASRRSQADQRSNGLSQSFHLVLSSPGDVIKIQGARSEPASGAATGGGGPQAPPTRNRIRATRLRVRGGLLPMRSSLAGGW